MQREKNILFIILALIFAILATGAVFIYMKNYEDRIMAQSSESVSVIATNIDIKSGTQIKDYMISSIPWPKSKVMDQHVTRAEEVIGKTVKIDITKGMPILKGFLLKKGDNISYFVPEKMRAMTLKFDDRNSDSLLISPGSFVDILATFQSRGSSPFTKTILQNVKVIAVNGKTEDDFTMGEDSIVNDVTVLIRPEQTEKLALAKTQAKIQIVLRNINDNEEVEKSGIDQETIIYGKRGDADTESAKPIENIVKRIPLKERTVKIIRGTDIQEVRVK